VGGVGQPEQQGAVAAFRVACLIDRIFRSAWLVDSLDRWIDGIGRRVNPCGRYVGGEGAVAGRGMCSVHAIISFDRSRQSGYHTRGSDILVDLAVG